MSERPLILVSNDDGVFAPGCVALRKALVEVGDVVTVAPMHQQSAGSHAITLGKPVRMHELESQVYTVDGTPADCVYVGLFHPQVLSRQPDLIVSGINHGPNLGNDVFYSGTVAAAREGAFRGIPSLAFSQMGRGADMERAAAEAAKLVRRTLETTLPEGPAPLLNVNIPEGEIHGVRATRLGQRHYDAGLVIRQDPRGRDYFWIGGAGETRHEAISGSDTEAVDEGYISVTPLRLESTYPDHLGVAAFIAGAETEGEE